MTLFGCSKPPPIPDEFIEKSLWAYKTQHYSWVVENTYWGSREVPDWESNDSFTDAERELLLEMLEGNCTASIEYQGNRATAVIDYSQSGIMEWLRVNKFGEPPALSASDREAVRNWCERFIYVNGRWYLAESWEGEGWAEGMRLGR